MSIVYVSGPMTGHDDLNFPAFNRAAESLRKAGHSVHNPAENPVRDDWDWSDYLRYDLRLVTLCDAIYTLPGWQRSPGAQLEVLVATALGLERMGEL